MSFLTISIFSKSWNLPSSTAWSKKWRKSSFDTYTLLLTTKFNCRQTVCVFIFKKRLYFIVANLNTVSYAKVLLEFLGNRKINCINWETCKKCCSRTGYYEHMRSYVHSLKRADLTNCDICKNVSKNGAKYLWKTQLIMSSKKIEWKNHITTGIQHENKINFTSKTKSLW